MRTRFEELTGIPDINGLDEVVAKNMAEALCRAYPGHNWAVTCDGDKGIATVRDIDLSWQWGYVLHLKHVYADPDMKCVVKAGGEILERFRVDRKPLKDYERILNLDMMADGNPVFDYAQTPTRVPQYIRDAYAKARRWLGWEPKLIVGGRE